MNDDGPCIGSQTERRSSHVVADRVTACGRWGDGEEASPGHGNEHGRINGMAWMAFAGAE